MFLTTQGLFLYKNKLYKQTDGVTMVCPLGPTLANFFLDCTEQKLVGNKSDFLPLVYLPYSILTIFTMYMIGKALVQNYYKC